MAVSDQRHAVAFLLLCQRAPVPTVDEAEWEGIRCIVITFELNMTWKKGI
jgi:hypothetical protein